jgi:hypothetical protein
MTTVFRLTGYACAIAALIMLGLCGYCAYETASFIHGADELTGTVVDIERHPAEKDRADFRPVVQLVSASGHLETHRFSGLYRVDGSAIGEPIKLLHNPRSAPWLAPDSRWNWIGSVVYGCFTLLLAAMSVLMFVMTRGIRRHPIPATN